MSTTPIVQFGTSRFLQAHADLFISEALQSGDALGPVTVVQTSGDPSRSRRLQALADPAGYEVRIKGLENGELVDASKTVKSIIRACSLPQDLSAVADIISNEARVLISNTADAGFKSQLEDQSTEFSSKMSYPAKLTWFLFQRFKSGGDPIQIMPAELIPQNGNVLRGLVLTIAEIYSPDFISWLETKVLWVNSLVDRIVSEPLEPAGAVAEPYGLWAIEHQPGIILPCSHPDVRLVKELDQFETLKLFILNLGHTYLVSRWLSSPEPKWQFVRELMEDPEYLDDLTDLYEQEVVPVFASHGREDEARAYINTTIDRFKNPFLDHKLEDIAQNHREKVARRIATFVAFAKRSDLHPQMPRLEALVKSETQAGAA
ncbi:Altronate oxidoreductase [Roseibium album]|nr:Altronate oxidoreductase [Roseibium album]